VLKRRASISLRLTLWFGGIFFLGWVLFGATMWFNLKSTLTRERYQTLARRVDRLQELLRKTQGEDQADRDQDFKDFANATGNGLAEVVRADGSLVFPSPSPAAQSFPWPAIRGGDTERFVQASDAGQSYWVLLRAFVLDRQPVYLLTAAPESGNLLVLSRFLGGLLASVPILLLISSAGGYLLSRTALKPVDRITAAVRSISIRNLSERLPVAKTGDELQRLAETCNAMLGRLESAVKRIEQFTADASHELRGPLSFTRTVAEVGMRSPRADPESRQAFADIVEEAAKASILLDDMLTLARADAVSCHTALEPVNLTAVVEETCEMVRPLADKRHLVLSVSLGAGRSAKVLGDSPSLRRLLWILLDNAMKYTEAPGRIEVILNEAAGAATLQVRDSGIGIGAEDLPHVFERFYCADPSRSQVDGSGLGLAIAKWIAEIHHADLSVDSARHQGTVFRVVFPQAAA
jgi:heavy metal sensor kinase